MKRLNFTRISIFLCLLWIITGSSLNSCSYKSKKPLQNQVNKEKYRTSFPQGNVSSELGNIMISVKKITNFTSYRTYILNPHSNVTLKNLNSQGIFEHARAGIVNSNATAGTALIIPSSNRNIVLLTCAHAVNAPDTIIEWSENRDLDNNQYIQSISLKIKQQLYVRDMPDGSKFRILASDIKNDIALIGSEYDEPVNGIEVFMHPCGNSSDLKWGSFLFLAGYPTGQQMIAHGIVSTLPEKAGSFLTDAPFNEGMSGGIALAITEAGGNFELVGLARSVAATYNYILKPEKENHEYNYNPAIPYTGSIYVNQKKDINYGVTSVISINQIKQFYNENRTSLTEAGFNLDDFFSKKKESE